MPAVASAQYTPKWRVGDWWVVKTWHEQMSAGWVWDYVRYDVVGVEKVGKRNCFVLEFRWQGLTDSLSGTKIVHYVRMDDWLVVRQVLVYIYQDKLRADKLDRPRGMFGPFLEGQLRLPRFPLRLGDPDTTFKLQVLDDCAAYLREISSAADPASVKRLLEERDTLGVRVVRPTGVVYEVREELGGNLDPPFTSEKNITQSLQLWSNDQPWRLYEEYVNYSGDERHRQVVERNWLIAVGHSEKSTPKH
jgi:hypothetical protein